MASQQNGLSAVSKQTGEPPATRFARLVSSSTPLTISGGFLDRGNDFLCGIEDVLSGNEREATFGESLLACVDIIAFETHDERNADVGFAGGIDNTMGDDVAVHDPAENIHQNALDVLVAQE